jgi:hypothetical protein
MMNFLTRGSKVMIAVSEDGAPIVRPFLDDQGNPKTDNRDRPIGSIMLTQSVRVMNGTFLNGANRVAFISGTIEELENIVKQNKLKVGSEVPGRIIQKESLTPFYPTQSAKINPQTQEAVGFTIGETFHPVYMQQIFVEDENTKDVLIRSVEEVEAILNAKKINTLTNQHAGQVNEEARVPGN